MTVSWSEPGAILSASVHAALLAMTLVGFTDAPKFEDAQETVPVEIVTDQQFNQITKGQKDAKLQPTPSVKADKASEVEEKKPTPIVEAKVDIAAPPPPLKRIPDPGDSNDPQTPTPPQRVAALPPDPPKPEPPKPPVRPAEPPKAEPKPDTPKPDAEAIEPPKPPQRPKDEPKKADNAPPLPPTRVRPPQKEEPLDRTAVAKLLEKKDDPPKPVARPKSGDETSTTKSRFDANSVAAILSHEQPSSRASSARTARQTASLGSPTANASKMSPSMWGQLDGLLQEQYKQCWSYIGLSSTRYIPQIKVAYASDGSLFGQPQLLNQPSDPNLRILSESALRAVRRCNPLKIPPQFMPYYDQWKDRILRFDPEEMAG